MRKSAEEAKSCLLLVFIFQSNKRFNARNALRNIYINKWE